MSRPADAEALAAIARDEAMLELDTWEFAVIFLPELCLCGKCVN